MRFSNGIRDWFALAPQKKLLRLAALACLLGFCLIVALHSLGSFLLVMPVALLGLVTLITADSEAPLLASVGAALAWGFSQRAEQVTSPLTLLAALLLLWYHTLLTVTAHGPGGAEPAPLTLRRWGLRSAAISAVTALAWVGLGALRQSPLHAPAWGRGVGLLALGALLVAAVALVRDREG